MKFGFININLKTPSMQWLTKRGNGPVKSKARQEEMLWQIIFRDAGFILLVDVLEVKSTVPSAYESVSKNSAKYLLKKHCGNSL